MGPQALDLGSAQNAAAANGQSLEKQWPDRAPNEALDRVPKDFEGAPDLALLPFAKHQSKPRGVALGIVASTRDLGRRRSLSTNPDPGLEGMACGGSGASFKLLKLKRP